MKEEKIKSVLITGANSGFGFYSAIEFAHNGFKVFATTRDMKKEGVKRLNKIVEEESLDIQWVVLDVTKADQVKAAFNSVNDSVDKLDVLVNNAGYGVLGPIETYKTEDFRTQFETNLFGLVDVTYAFLPLLKKSKNASIVNVSSIAGLIAAPVYGLYSSSKWALEAYSEVLRYELSGYGINVTLINPGGFDTKFSNNAVGLGVEHECENEVEWFNRIKEKRSMIMGKFSGWLRDPERVARKIYKLSIKRRTKLRNVIGLDATFMIIFRRILPNRVWGWIVEKMIS